MIAKLTVEEKDISFILVDISINQFRMVGTRPMNENKMIVEKYPMGEPITLITSNMPKQLNDEIIEIISNYCNH